MAKATRKHVYLYDMHIEVLDEIISTHEDIPVVLVNFFLEENV